MANAKDLTGRHIKRVAELIGGNLYYPLGTKLGFSFNELDNLVTPPTGGPTQYAARMLHKWRNEHANLTADEVSKKLFVALEASNRADIATEVNTKLQTEYDVERVFQDITGKLVKDWVSVGIELGIPRDDLQAAKASLLPEDDHVMCMLQRWRQGTSPLHQRPQLLTALSELKLQNVVRAIEKIDQEVLGQPFISLDWASGGASSQLQTLRSPERVQELRKTSLLPNEPVQLELCTPVRSSSQFSQSNTHQACEVLTSVHSHFKSLSEQITHPQVMSLDQTTKEIQPTFISRQLENPSQSVAQVQSSFTTFTEEETITKKYLDYLKGHGLDWFIAHDCAPDILKETIVDPEIPMSHKHVEKLLNKEKEKIENSIQQMQLSYMGSADSMKNKPFRCVLLGKTGDGKSSLGNLLIGREVFGVSHNAKSQTHTIQYCHTANVEVIDTPGLGDSNKEVDAEFEIAKIFENFKEGVHCFLYVFSMGNKRADDADVEIFKKIKNMFGEMMKTHTILVLTHPDEKLCNGSGLRDYIDSIGETALGEIFSIIGNRIIAVDNASKGYRRELHREGVIDMIEQSVHNAYQAGYGECYTPTFLADAKNALEEYRRKQREKIEENEKQTDRIVKDSLNEALSTADVDKLLELTYSKETQDSIIERVIETVPSGREYARKEGVKILKDLVERELHRVTVQLVNAYVPNCNSDINEYIEAIQTNNAQLVGAVGKEHVASLVGIRYRELQEKKLVEERLARLKEMEAVAAQAEKEKQESEARLRRFMEAQVKEYITQNISLHDQPDMIIAGLVESNPNLDRQKTEDLVQRFLWSGEGRVLVDNHVSSVRDTARREAISEMECWVGIALRTFLSEKTRTEMGNCKTDATYYQECADKIISDVKRLLTEDDLKFLNDSDIQGNVLESLNASINNVNNAGFLEKCRMALSFIYGKDYTEELMGHYVHVQSSDYLET